MINCACRLERKSSAPFKKDIKKNDDTTEEDEQDDLYVERIRIENLDLRFFFVIIKSLYYITLFNNKYYFAYIGLIYLLDFENCCNKLIQLIISKPKYNY